MASITLQVGAEYAVGTTVSVYNTVNSVPTVPVGSVVTTGTVGSDGTVTFSGLTAGISYLAYAASGRPQYVRFLVSSSSSSGGALPTGGTTGQVVTNTVPGEGDWEDPAVTSADLADVTSTAVGAVAATALGAAFGEQNGVPLSPWNKTPVQGDELWALAHMDTGSGHVASLTPSLTANGTDRTQITRFILNQVSWVTAQPSYRLEFDYSCPVGGIDLAQVTFNGSDIQLGERQQVVSKTSDRTTGRFIFDFQVLPGSNAAGYLDVRLQTSSSESSGTVSISNGTLKRTGGVRRPLLIGKAPSTSADVSAFFQQRREKTNDWRIARLLWTNESELTSPHAFSAVDGWATTDMFPLGYPDASFQRTYASLAGVGVVGIAGGVGYGSLRVNNNDQIFYVQNVAGGYEYRGNTHGGETVRGSASWKVDRGGGLAAWTPDAGLLPVWRAQLTLPTHLARTDEPSGTYFANVDHVYTMFPDGMVRCDRTTTFLKDVVINTMFEWMSSHNPGGTHVARLGAGGSVIGEFDTVDKAATPAAPTVTTSGTGGVLTAATYSYRVAARTAYGETVASAATTVAATGSTSKNTVTWVAVTGATAYAIYGRVAGYERLLTVAGPGMTSWADDGTVGSTSKPKEVSTARRQGTAVAADGASSSDTTWGAYYDPDYQWAIANIYDRDAVLSRPGVNACWTKMECIGGAIQKNYAILGWNGDENHAVSAGTVWTATHWTYIYRPNDTDLTGDWHHEVALRAANLSALTTLYPAS